MCGDDATQTSCTVPMDTLVSDYGYKANDVVDVIVQAVNEVGLGAFSKRRDDYYLVRLIATPSSMDPPQVQLATSDSVTLSWPTVPTADSYTLVWNQVGE